MKIAAGFGVLVCTIVAVLSARNLTGKSLYVYLHLGEHDLIFDSSGGISHHGWAEHIDISSNDVFFADALGSSYQLGPVALLLENSGAPIDLTRFSYHFDGSYHSLEFPLPIWLVIPGGIFLIAYRRKEALFS